MRLAMLAVTRCDDGKGLTGRSVEFFAAFATMCLRTNTPASPERNGAANLS
jgi:hypothetical protein